MSARGSHLFFNGAEVCDALPNLIPARVAVAFINMTALVRFWIFLERTEYSEPIGIQGESWSA